MEDGREQRGERARGYGDHGDGADPRQRGGEWEGEQRPWLQSGSAARAEPTSEPVAAGAGAGSFSGFLQGVMSGPAALLRGASERAVGDAAPLSAREPQSERLWRRDGAVHISTSPARGPRGAGRLAESEEEPTEDSYAGDV